MNSQTVSLPSVVQTSVAKFVRFLESSGVDTPEGTFAPDVQSDLSFPRWRVQVAGVAELVAARQRWHREPGNVRLEGVTGNERGYAVKLEERWQQGGQEWYSREGFICLLDEEGRIEDFTLYCTGDWSAARVREHAAAVSLIGP